MRFGIVTLVSENYGNKYQNFAVEQILREFGDVETFSVFEKYTFVHKNVSKIKKLKFSYIRKVLASRLLYKYDIKNLYRGLFRNLLYALQNKSKLIELKKNRGIEFAKYQKKYLNISEKVLDYENTKDLKWLSSIDYFVCGSDQIWNPTYKTTTSLAFLSFADYSKSIAFSPSFGLSVIPEERKEDFSKWINDIKYLSVREKQGKDIIKELTNRESEVLLDPSMILSKDVWIEHMCEPIISLPKKYILTYFLGYVDKKFKKIIDEYSKDFKLEVVNLFDVFDSKYYTMTPNEVLYMIYNAELVITDSFHGSVFSILFCKNFVVMDRNEGELIMSSRLLTLLSKFNLSNRMGMTLSNYDSITDSQWREVSNILEVEREKAYQFLKNSLEKSE